MIFKVPFFIQELSNRNNIYSIHHLKNHIYEIFPNKLIDLILKYNFCLNKDDPISNLESLVIF